MLRAYTNFRLIANSRNQLDYIVLVMGAALLKQCKLADSARGVHTSDGVLFTSSVY